LRRCGPLSQWLTWQATRLLTVSRHPTPGYLLWASEPSPGRLALVSATGESGRRQRGYAGRRPACEPPIWSYRPDGALTHPRPPHLGHSLCLRPWCIGTRPVALHWGNRQIDIGKETLPIVAYESDGQIVLPKKIKALGLESELKKLPPSIVGLET
jgi:hypothetical protein